MHPAKINSILLTALLFVWTTSLYASPSAKDLLDACRKNLDPSYDTSHIKYRTTSIMGNPGSTPTTIVQMHDIYKKKPDMMRLSVDNGLTIQESLIRGGYLYFKGPKGDINVLKAGDEINPFGKVQNTLDNFDQATVESYADTDAVVKLQGGKYIAADTYILVNIDPSLGFINQITTYKNHVRTSVVDFTYGLMDSSTQKKLKTMTVECGTANLTLSAVTEFLANECNEVLSDDLFDPEKGLK